MQRWVQELSFLDRNSVIAVGECADVPAMNKTKSEQTFGLNLLLLRNAYKLHMNVRPPTRIPIQGRRRAPALICQS